MNRYTVAVECPSCAAPLDFNEGSNAVRCLHCRTNLLVTGRKQILSYYVEPGVDERAAASGALAAHKSRGVEGCRIIQSSLYFIPYYRLTGHDFRWEETALKPAAGEADYEAIPAHASGGESSFFHFAGDFMGRLFSSGVDGETTPQESSHAKEIISPLFLSKLPGDRLRGRAEIQINDRYIEKNFVACNLSGVGLYSLGIRPAALKLKLFRKETLGRLGKTVALDIGPEAALSRGMKGDSTGVLLCRAVIGRILSIVYFPFWAVELEGRDTTFIAIVDAVSKAVIKADAATSLNEPLNRRSGDHQKVVGFRPLVCPNCGWDLPLRTDDVVFFCSSCNKAWQIYGSYLNEVSYQVAECPDPSKKDKARYLPFWILGAENGSGEAFRYYLPAFRYRRLKALADLAMGMTGKQPAYTASESKRPEVHDSTFEGCCYDQEDAALLAHFIHAGLKLRQRGRGKDQGKDAPVFTEAALTWFPYTVSGSSLIDPFTGISLSQSLLL